MMDRSAYNGGGMDSATNSVSTQQTMSTIGSTSVVGARSTRSNRTLDVESQGFKLTHNDEYFCEMATKVIVFLANNNNTSGNTTTTEALALLQQDYSLEVLQLFAKAVIFRMKILKALRSGSLARERRVDSLTERCYTRLGLDNTESSTCFLKQLGEQHQQQPAPQQQQREPRQQQQRQPTAYPQTTATTTSTTTAGVSAAFEKVSAVSEVKQQQQHSAAAATPDHGRRNFPLDNNNTIAGNNAMWDELSRPASPIRIRQTPPKQQNSPSLYNHHHQQQHQNLPGMMMNSINNNNNNNQATSSHVINNNGPLPLQQNQSNFGPFANNNNNIGGNNSSNLPNSNGTPQHHQSQQQQYMSPSRSINMNNNNNNAKVLVEEHHPSSSSSPQRRRNNSNRAIVNHALADDVDSSEAESMGRNNEKFFLNSQEEEEEGWSGHNGYAVRVNDGDGSAVRINTTNKDDQKVMLNYSEEAEEQPLFVPLQTISFGNKQSKQSSSNNKSGSTISNQMNAPPMVETSPDLMMTMSVGTEKTGRQHQQQCNSVKSSATETLQREYMKIMTQLPPQNNDGPTISNTNNDSPTKKEYGDNSAALLLKKYGGDGRVSPLACSVMDDSTNKKIPYLEAVQRPLAKVVAPANLPQGYAFEARVGNKRFIATVPTGGISKGETFYSYIRELDRVEVSVPVGEWRDDLCDCCAYGPCHPLFLNALCCPHVALGQIMTRSGLDYKGHDAHTFMSRQTCITLIITIATYICLNAMILGLMANDYVAYGEFPPSWQLIVCLAGLNILFIVYTYYTISSTRTSLRSRYMIPERRCKRCEDCCCTLFCTFCTITQMGRHTGDFGTFRTVCCNSTGLPPHVTVPRNPDAAYYEHMHDVDEANFIVA